MGRKLNEGNEDEVVIGVVFFLAVIMCGGQNAFAMHFTTAPMAATLDCSGINVTNSSTIRLTGTGQEAYQVAGTDGAGNVIYQFSNSFTVGSTLSQPPATVPWMVAPQYNPLTLRIVSLAGNGLPEQMLVSFSGTCQGLPPYSTAVPTMDERMGYDHLFRQLPCSSLCIS